MDEVLDVLEIGADRVEPPPRCYAVPVDVGLLKGIGKADGRMVLRLDAAAVLSCQRWRDLATAPSSGAAASSHPPARQAGKTQ